MRTYEQQADLIEAKLCAHNAKRKKQKSAVIALCSMLTVVTAVISVIGFSNAKNNNSTISSSADIDAEIGTTTPTTMTGAATDFEIISATKFYGKIAESKLTTDEIRRYVGETIGNISVYEDENYRYFFNADGSLHSIMNNSEIYTSIYLEADNESIKEYAEVYLRRYIVNFNPDLYNIEVSHNKNALPEWDLTYTVSQDGIITEKIYIRFISNGDLYYLSRQIGSDLENMTIKQAVDIALDTVNSQYGVDISNKEEFEISAFSVQDETGYHFNVTVGGIYYGEEPDIFERSYFVKISEKDGAITIESDSCR